MTEVLVYATASRAQTARALLGAACRATDIGVRLELYGSGSLYQRLGPRHAPPLPDVVLWLGPFAAQSAGLDGLLQPYQPASVAAAALHDPKWYWTTLDYRPIGVVGPTGVQNLQDLAGVPGVAMADPERSEVGLSILLATLDRARQRDGDVERAWTWWVQRAARGLVLAEEDPDALAIVSDGGASHALTVAETAAPVPGLAPIPHAVGLAANSPHPAAAKRLLDWLTSDAAGDTLKYSPWRAATNGLEALLSAAPPLDVEWCRQNYTATRRRWAASGFGPQLTG
ncbi:MAG TPA: substrate-binding domain-containing protein [Chloroflexota bacterium]|nr:substrate-binding domain-containing protein [Chloroflexota bacterium]